MNIQVSLLGTQERDMGIARKNKEEKNNFNEIELKIKTKNNHKNREKINGNA